MARISRFSPNWSNPDELEAITVARETLIASAVDSARESALTKNKHHRLFIGPRGSGKTHLITLIRHRLVQMDDLNDTLRIAWLNEDETSDTLLSLLLRVYRSLSREYPVEFPADLTEAVFDLKNTQEATLAITELLLQKLQDKTILLLIENLDELFSSFGEVEQKSWRALMQNYPQFCTIATAQRLFRGVSNRDAPFFGFFQAEYLKPFDSSEASELFTKIAELRKDTALKQFIGSLRGRARIRALHHLTGGNQRLFIILSEFIDRESLDSLVGPFEELVDEQLTPYYQERLRWVSPLQRRIVEYLSTVAKPEPVKTIARRLFSTSQTISKQLQELRKLGYVSSRSRGRESLYELAEPLMRLSYQVKEARGRSPLRLLVDFLRVWYDQQELLQRMQLVEGEKSVTRNYLSAAIALYEMEGNLRLHYLKEDTNGIDPGNCDAKQIELLRDLMEESGEPIDCLRYGQAQFFKGHHKEAIEAFTRVISMNEVPSDLLGRALLFRACASVYVKGEIIIETIIQDLNQLIELLELIGVSSNMRCIAHNLRATIYLALGNTRAAISDYRAVIEFKGVKDNTIPGAHLGLASLLMQKGNWAEAGQHLNKGFVLIEDQDQKFLSIFTPNYVYTILNSGHSRDAWEQGVVLLIDIFAKNSATNHLGTGLIKSIEMLQSSSLSPEGLSAWYTLWEEQAQQHPELELPVRLLRTAIDFIIADGDTSVLLDLPQEERRILATVLKLDA